MAGQVCSYYLQNKCRYGNRCRYRHPPREETMGRERGRQGDPSPFIQTGPWQQKGVNRFEYFNSDGGRRGSMGGWQGNQGNNWKNSTWRGGSGGNFRGGSSSGWHDHGLQPGNPFKSPPATNIGWSGSEWRGGGGGLFSSSKPETTDMDTRQDNPTTHREIAASIQKNVTLWEKNGMWTLSCYGPLCSKCLPDFSDYSPEEIRLEAYQCNIAGNPQSYLELISNLVSQRQFLWKQYSAITPEDVAKLTLDGKPLFSSVIQTPPIQGSSKFFTGMQESKDSSIFGQTPSRDLFGVKANSSSASFLSPPPQGDTSTLSIPQELSESDIAAFKASHFELGSIPEVPPPPQLCY